MASRGSMFRYAEADCDVHDRSRLKGFRSKLEEWWYLMSHDEASIAQQFGEMMWQDLAWRTANEARQYADKDGNNAAVAPLLAMMLDRGYVSGQVIAITRLLEFSDPKHPKKGVISLRRLVDDVQASRNLITREVFVAHDALPYEWEALQKAEFDRISERAAADPDKVAVTHFSTTGPDGFDGARQQHELFDLLAGVSPEHRSRDDLIAEDFFAKLNGLLEDPLLLEIKDLRNKTIAHSADHFSRSQKILRTGLSLEEFSRAQFLLFSVYQTLSVVLLGQWRGSPVPTPQHDMFEYLTAPFLGEHRLDAIHAFRSAYVAEREEWSSRGYHEVIPRGDGPR